jgi:hypothetical protein
MPIWQNNGEKIMKYLIDKISSMTKQSVSAAAIVDSNGNMAGKVLVRFTDSQIGWNHEVSAVIYDSEGMVALNMRNSRKGGTYDKPLSLYALFDDAGFVPFTHNDRSIGSYDNKRDVNVDSLSTFSDIAYVKKGNKRYSLMWVC